MVEADGRLVCFAVERNFMPLFEFRCRTCNHAFEEIVRADQLPSCPACESVEVSKLMSAFAVGRGGGRTRSLPSPAATGGT
jgi:putative FmdB family regulatory protein